MWADNAQQVRARQRTRGTLTRRVARRLARAWDAVENAIALMLIVAMIAIAAGGTAAIVLWGW
jgi:hypothetical protein